MSVPRICWWRRDPWDTEIAVYCYICRVVPFWYTFGVRNLWTVESNKESPYYEQILISLKGVIVYENFLPHNSELLLWLPADEVWDKVMFLLLSVSHSVHGGVMMSLPAMDSTPSPGQHTHPDSSIHPTGQHHPRSTSGWYESYWNAFLFKYLNITSTTTTQVQGFKYRK